jgi:signal transduction histidine kinase
VRRRIGRAIVLSTALALVTFGVPLALILARTYREQAVLSLERQASQAAQEVPVSSLLGAEPVDWPATAPGQELAVYRTDGARVVGTGPVRADPVVDRAIHGHLSDRAVGDRLAVAVPVVSEEQVFAVVRASVPRSSYEARVRRAWAMMVVFAAVLLGLAQLVGRGVARRLSEPVDALVANVQHLGAGEFTLEHHPAGTPEVDRAHHALADAARRLGEVMARERAFTSAVSHQLRTPLTALRLDIEAARTRAPDDADLRDAESQADHLEQTITDLLALTRGPARNQRSELVTALAEDAARRWRPVLEPRPLRLEIHRDTDTLLVSAEATRQIIDVLVANALHHGAGTVTMRVAALPGAARIEVSDQGRGFTADPFADPPPRQSSHGLGLGLARRLARAEGGDIRLGAGNEPDPGATTVVGLLMPVTAGSAVPLT